MSNEKRIDDEVRRALRRELSDVRLSTGAKRTIRSRVREVAGPFGWRERAAVGVAAAGLAAIFLNLSLLFAVPQEEPQEMVVVQAGMPAAAIIYRIEHGLNGGSE